MIGSNLARTLLEEGNRVIGVDNFWRGRSSVVSSLQQHFPTQFEFFERDLKDTSSIVGLLGSVNHVYHLADVVAGINFVFANEYFVWSENTRINSSVLAQVLNSSSKPSLTYVGTSCSYPMELTKNHSAPRALIETDIFPANPESSYGWSKLIGEYEILLAEAESDLEASILRLDNVYGYPCELQPQKSQVIPALVVKAINAGPEPLEVWGSGNQRRSFIHVGDVVQALRYSRERGLGKGPIQIGPGESVSIRSIAERVREISGKSFEIHYDLTKPEGDGDRYADISKAKNLLGWEPQISLEEGLADLFDRIERELASSI